MVNISNQSSQSAKKIILVSLIDILPNDNLISNNFNAYKSDLLQQNFWLGKIPTMKTSFGSLCNVLLLSLPMWSVSFLRYHLIIWWFGDFGNFVTGEFSALVAWEFAFSRKVEDGLLTEFLNKISVDEVNKRDRANRLK